MKRSHSPLAGVGYFVAAVLILFPLIDLVANLWPLDPSRVNWRYGAYVLLSGFVLTVLLGFALALLLSRLAEHRKTARVLAVLSGLGGIVLLAAAVAFALDALQLRASVSEDARTQFGIGAVKAVVKNTIAAAGFLWIAWAAWRAPRGQRASRDAASLIS